MPKSNAVPILSASESEVFMPDAKSSSHTIKMIVTRGPGELFYRFASVSDERLVIKSGADVVFDVQFVPKDIQGILEIRFAGPKPTKGADGRNHFQFARRFGEKDHPEVYSVAFEGGPLKFVSSSNPPLSSPSLVIQPVADPPGEKLWVWTSLRLRR
jgi:hypothetical protein